MERFRWLLLIVAGIICAIVTTTERDVNGDRAGGIKLGPSNAFEFEAIERHMVRGVFERIIVFNVPINVEMSIPVSDLLECRNRNILCGDSDEMFWTGGASDNRNIIHIRKFKIGRNWVFRSIIIDINRDLLWRRISGVLNGGVEIYAANHIAENVHLSIHVIGENKWSLNLIKIISVYVVSAVHGTQFKAGNYGVSCGDNGDDHGCCRGCMIDCAKADRRAPFDPIDSDFYHSPLRIFFIIAGCALVALAVLFLNGFICSIADKRPMKALCLLCICMAVWFAGALLIYLAFAQNAAADMTTYYCLDPSHASSISTTSFISQSRFVTPAAIAGDTFSV